MLVIRKIFRQMLSAVGLGFVFVSSAAIVLFSHALLASSSEAQQLSHPSSFLGISPQDEQYFSESRISCRDGSKIFDQTRLNDGFCDCPDGTDEPGTSACPESKFYCRNIGDVPQLLFSSRVNDHICDCRDGSDEYDGGIVCRSMSIKNESNDLSVRGALRSSDTKEANKFGIKGLKYKVGVDDLLENLKGLKIITVVEMAFLMSLLILLYRKTRIRRRGFILC